MIDFPGWNLKLWRPQAAPLTRPRHQAGKGGPRTGGRNASPAAETAWEANRLAPAAGKPPRRAMRAKGKTQNSGPSPEQIGQLACAS
jgi:hypothetical protein